MQSVVQLKQKYSQYPVHLLTFFIYLGTYKNVYKQKSKWMLIIYSFTYHKATGDKQKPKTKMFQRKLGGYTNIIYFVGTPCIFTKAARFAITSLLRFTTPARSRTAFTTRFIIVISYLWR